MSSMTCARGLTTTAALFGAVLLVNGFTAGDALGDKRGGGLGGGIGNAVGGAVAGIGGAVGGALGGGGGSPGNGNNGSGGPGVGNGEVASNGGPGVSSPSAEAAARGETNSMGIVSVEDEERCRNTLLGLLGVRDCESEQASLPEPDMSEIEQAVLPPVAEPPIPRAKPEKKAVELTVAPKPSMSAQVEKQQPKPEPALSCDKAGAIVGDYGFSAVAASDCEGEVYGFNASRDGKAFTVTLNAASGELVTVRKVP